MKCAFQFQQTCFGYNRDSWDWVKSFQTPLPLFFLSKMFKTSLVQVKGVGLTGLKLWCRSSYPIRLLFLNLLGLQGRYSSNFITIHFLISFLRLTENGDIGTNHFEEHGGSFCTMNSTWRPLDQVPSSHVVMILSQIQPDGTFSLQYNIENVKYFFSPVSTCFQAAKLLTENILFFSFFLKKKKLFTWLFYSQLDSSFQSSWAQNVMSDKQRGSLFSYCYECISLNLQISR